MRSELARTSAGFRDRKLVGRERERERDIINGRKKSKNKTLTVKRKEKGLTSKIDFNLIVLNFLLN